MHYLRHEHLNALRAVDDPMAAEAIDFILEHWVPRRDSDLVRAKKYKARAKKYKAACEQYETEVADLKRKLRNTPNVHLDQAIRALNTARASLERCLGG